MRGARHRGHPLPAATSAIRHDPSPGVDATNHAEGWYYEVVGTGPEGCRAYGEYLGRRFGRFDNIIWCIGGDWNPDEPRGTGLDAIAAGIRSTGVNNLFTAHVPARRHRGSTPSRAPTGWMSTSPTPTASSTAPCSHDWRRQPVTPYVLIESTYEGEHNASDLQVRRQAWWSVLCGAVGHCMGNNPIWLFWDGWQAALDLPASVAMARWGAFFRPLPWADLVPDTGLRLVTSGLGESRGLDRVTAALTSDGRVGVAYLPVPAAGHRRPGCRHRQPGAGHLVRARDRAASVGRHAANRGRGDADAAVRRGFRRCCSSPSPTDLSVRHPVGPGAPSPGGAAWPSSPSMGRSLRIDARPDAAARAPVLRHVPGLSGAAAAHPGPDGRAGRGPGGAHHVA